MGARFMPLVVAIFQVLPYAYCLDLRMVVQFVGGAK